MSPCLLSSLYTAGAEVASFFSSALSSLEVLKESWGWGATGGGGARQVNCRKLRWGRGASEVGSGSFPQLPSAPTQLGGGGVRAGKPRGLGEHRTSSGPGAYGVWGCQAAEVGTEGPKMLSAQPWLCLLQAKVELVSLFPGRRSRALEDCLRPGSSLWDPQLGFGRVTTRRERWGGV